MGPGPPRRSLPQLCGKSFPETGKFLPAGTVSNERERDSPIFASIDKALVAAVIMGILFIVQTYTGFSLSWVTPETVSTIIRLITPVLVWAIPNKKRA